MIQRELKFRAFDDAKKVMHQNVSFFRTGIDANNWIVFTSDKEFHKTDERGIIFDNPYFSQQIKIMQFAGISDGNGKEIYEGDILLYCDSYFTVFFNGNTACFDCLNEGDKETDPQPLYEMIQNDSEDPQVVGNIYENSELLNKK